MKTDWHKSKTALERLIDDQAHKMDDNTLYRKLKIKNRGNKKNLGAIFRTTQKELFDDVYRHWFATGEINI